MDGNGLQPLQKLFNRWAGFATEVKSGFTSNVPFTSLTFGKGVEEIPSIKASGVNFTFKRVRTVNGSIRVTLTHVGNKKFERDNPEYTLSCSESGNTIVRPGW